MASASSSTPCTVRRSGWRGPAGEVGAVVGNVEADPHQRARLDRVRRCRRLLVVRAGFSASWRRPPGSSPSMASSVGLGGVLGVVVGSPIAARPSSASSSLDVSSSRVLVGSSRRRPRPRRPRSPTRPPRPRRSPGCARSAPSWPPSWCRGPSRPRPRPTVSSSTQLDDRHRRVVALARAGLDDPGVAAGTGGHLRADLGEQLVHDVLVADHRHHLAAGVQVAALGEGDQPLGQRAQPLGLGLGGGDAVVLEQRRGQVRQHQPLVRGAAAEAGTLGGRGHVVILSFGLAACREPSRRPPGLELLGLGVVGCRRRPR